MTCGFYGPESQTWRLSRERVMLLGGPRALVLQLAHPLVAAGVRDHSSFPADPLLRLRRTLEATLAIIFGTRDEALAAASRINAVHDAVHGELPESAGRYVAATPYDATDPELALWVHATLVDTTFEIYPRFVGPLSYGEMEQAYEESKIAAELLRVPKDIVPPDLVSFRRYMAGMLTSDRLAAAPFQRELVGDVLRPKLGPPLHRVPGRAWWPMVAITTALLPPRIRDLYGLELTPARRRAATCSRVLVRGILPLLPRAVRDQPQARRAVKRTRGTR